MKQDNNETEHKFAIFLGKYNPLREASIAYALTYAVVRSVDFMPDGAIFEREGAYLPILFYGDYGKQKAEEVCRKLNLWRDNKLVMEEKH